MSSWLLYLFGSGIEEPLHEAGTFFTRFTFGILASMFMSNQVRDWLISDLPSRMKKLAETIREEIDKLGYSDVMNDGFEVVANVALNQGKETLNAEIKRLNFWKHLIVNCIHIGGGGALLGIIYSICTGYEKELGVLPLLLLVLLYFARKKLNIVYTDTETKHAQIAKQVSTIKESAHKHTVNTLRKPFDNVQTSSSTQGRQSQAQPVNKIDTLPVSQLDTPPRTV